jgi:hypothetical protein
MSQDKPVLSREQIKFARKIGTPYFENGGVEAFEYLCDLALSALKINEPPQAGQDHDTAPFHEGRAAGLASGSPVGDRMCPHCGLKEGVAWGGTPYCQQPWSGSPEARPSYPGCLLRCRSGAKVQVSQESAGLASIQREADQLRKLLKEIDDSGILFRTNLRLDAKVANYLSSIRSKMEKAGG